MSALKKTLVVLDAVLESRQPIGLAELTKLLDENKGTLHRRLQQLEREGVLLRNGHGRYAAGPRLSTLALHALLSSNHAAPVRALLDKVADEVEESCTIGVLQGFDYVVTELSESPKSLRTHMHVGSRAQAHCLAGGKVLLADLDAASLQRLIGANRLEARTRNTITRRPALESELVNVRAKGYALNNQESLDDVVAIAVPIRGRGERVVAALTLHGPTSRLSLKACRAHLPRLQRAASQIARIWYA